MENNNSFPWISSLGAKKNLGTMAGTTVLCTQYPARVTTSIYQMVGIATNVALTTVGRCSGQACLRWRLFLAFGLIILSLTWCFTQVGMLTCILIGTATLFANTTPYGENWAPGIPGSPCYTRGPTRGPMIYQGAHQGGHYGYTRGPTRGPTKAHQGAHQGAHKESWPLIFVVEWPTRS